MNLTNIKRLSLVTLILGAVFLSSLNAQETRLNVESNHSTIQFSVPISGGITLITGKFTDYSMDIQYDSINFLNSRFSLIIKTNSIDTGIEGRDEHLRTADFFEVETYPEITFTSEAIKKNDTGGFLMAGDFTMKGVTKKIELPLQITGKDGKYTVGFSTSLSLKRSDYGVGTEFKHTSMDNFISDDIEVRINFWTKKWKEPKEK